MSKTHCLDLFCVKRVYMGGCLQPPCGDPHACILHFGQPASVALCSGGPGCCSILLSSDGHIPMYTCFRLLTPIPPTPSFSASQFLHERKSLCGPLLHLLDAGIGEVDKGCNDFLLFSAGVPVLRNAV